MITDDQLMGKKPVDMEELKEIKVKLPVRQLLQLHYAKLTSARSISEVVNQALIVYFEDMRARAHATPA
jgi:hypothetical protein